MEALIVTILRTVLAPTSAPSPGGSEAFSVDVFSPIELLREGHDRVDIWSPTASVAPDDRDVGYLFVLRPDIASAAPGAGAPYSAVSTESSSAQRVASPPHSAHTSQTRAERSAFGDDTDDDHEDYRIGAATDTASRPPQLHSDAEAHTAASNAEVESTVRHSTHASTSQTRQPEEEELLLPHNRIDLQRRAAFLIWTSGHFLSSRAPSLLRAVIAVLATNTPASPAPRTVLVPSATVDLWCAEFTRARNRDALVCDAVCMRPREVVGVATDTLFVTARDRRIQALTLAIRSGSTGPVSPRMPPTALSSSAFLNVSDSEIGHASDVVGEYCFAFHMGGLTRFVTALRSLLPPRIVRDMMLQQAASVNSIQITQATAAATANQPTVKTNTVGARSGVSLPSPTTVTCVPHGDDAPLQLSRPHAGPLDLPETESDSSTPSSPRGSRRHGTWRAMSRWANASLQKMKDSWQASTTGHGSHDLNGDGDDSEGDIFDIPTSSVLTATRAASGARTGAAVAGAGAATAPRQMDSYQSLLVPVLTVPGGTSGPSTVNSRDSPLSTSASSHALVPFTEDEWLACFQPDGSLDERRYERARQKIFYGGVEAGVRQEVWLYLLGIYPATASAQQRVEVTTANALLYAKCSDQWQSFTAEQLAHFKQLKAIIHAVDKDVARTDRNIEAYRDDDSVKLGVLRRVLMAHVMMNFDLGYCQGMSDVLSPLTLMCESEETVFLLFRCALARRMHANFSMDPRSGLPARLRDLQVIVRHFFPQLYAHLRAQSSDNMMFCFRWVLMAYKREFPTADVYKLWDVLFAAPTNSDFDLVVAAGLLKGLEPQLLRLHGCDRIVMFANNLNGNVAVEDVIWFAHDFYNQMCVEHARLAALRAGGVSTVIGVTSVSVHEMASLCLLFDGALPAEEL